MPLKWFSLLMLLVLTMPTAKAGIGEECFLLGSWDTPGWGDIRFRGYADSLTLIPEMDRLSGRFSIARFYVPPGADSPVFGAQRVAEMYGTYTQHGDDLVMTACQNCPSIGPVPSLPFTLRIVSVEPPRSPFPAFITIQNPLSRDAPLRLERTQPAVDDILPFEISHWQLCNDLAKK